MTQLPNWGEPSGDQYNQYQRYGQEQGQYQEQPPSGYGGPWGQSSESYGQQRGNESHYNQGQEGYQAPPYPPPQRQYGGPSPQHEPSYGSPPPQHQSSYGSPPPAPTYGQPENQERFAGQQYPTQSQGYPPQDQGYDQNYQPPGYPPTGPGGPQDPNQADRGLMGALGGAAAGGFAGHQVHHGFLGALGGAYAGHKLEDHIKDEKKKKKAEEAAAMGATGAAAAYAHGRPGSSSGSHGQKFAGNFSGSSEQISLDRDYDLIAACWDSKGHKELTSIKLNDVLTNDNGHFRWVSHGGNFGASARHVRLENNGKVLVAELCSIDGHWKEDAVWLDERITNDDGDLKCLV